MGFFSKNKKKEGDFRKEDYSKLPNLPPVPNAPRLPEPISEDFNEDDKSFSLPSFPRSSIGQKMNQDTIKSALNEPEREEISYAPQYPQEVQRTLPDLSERNSFQRFPKNNFGNKNSNDGKYDKIRAIEIPDWSKNVSKKEEFSKVKRAEPIFIKLEKFEHTILTFNDIKSKIFEMESMLRNIREVRAKEERDIDKWERELETIKAKLDQVDRDFFKDI